MTGAFALRTLILTLGFTLIACLSPTVSDPEGDAPEAHDTALPDTGARDTTSPRDTTPEPVVDLSDEVFAPDRLLEIEIEMAEADWDQLRRQSRSLFDIVGPNCLDAPVESPFSWFVADVTIDGERIEQVAVRKKGFLGSLSDTKPSLKIKFGEYVDNQRYMGMKRLTLNNNKQDEAFINTCLGYHFMAQAGLPAPRCNFASVSVNGQHLGVFSHVDSIKSAFLERHFVSAEGNLYEGQLADFRQGWTGTFQRKNNSTTPERTDIDAAVAALTVPDDELEAAVSSIFDLDAFLTFWATEVLVAHWDGYAGDTNNYYIYNDPASQRFHFIPWGADALFNRNRNLSGTGSFPASVMAQGELARRLYLNPPTRDRYIERMREVLELWDEDALLTEIDRMEALIAPHVEPERAPGLATQIERRRNFIRNRRGQITAELDAGGAPWNLPLRPIPCMTPRGEMTATFDTTWGTHGAANPFAAGSGSFTLSIDGTTLPITLTGATAGYGDDERAGQAQLTVLGRLDDGRIYIAAFFIEPQRLTRASLPLDFTTIEGYLLVIDPNISNAPQLLGLVGNGYVFFNTASTRDGASVSGLFEAELFNNPF